MRDFILTEIKRLAKENGGVPPGQSAFTKATGITASKWRGVLWVRWSEAIGEAGLEPNSLRASLDSDNVLEAIGRLTREVGRLPTYAEIRMARVRDPAFPSHQAIRRHFGGKDDLPPALRKLAESDEKWSDLDAFLPEAGTDAIKPSSNRPDGFVYLLKSGSHYKIGRSEDIERRFREVKIALPEAVTLVHSIRTDDPSGIEAYWHRRFADRRANGEWFKLTADDLRSFRRRTFQ